MSLYFLLCHNAACLLKPKRNDWEEAQTYNHRSWSKSTPWDIYGKISTRLLPCPTLITISFGVVSSYFSCGMPRITCAEQPHFKVFFFYSLCTRTRINQLFLKVQGIVYASPKASQIACFHLYIFLNLCYLTIFFTFKGKRSLFLFCTGILSYC